MSISLPLPKILRAVEFIKPLNSVNGGRTGPCLIEAVDDNKDAYELVLKLKEPVSGYGEGNYGPTSLACELICAILAQCLNMNVPDYAIVNVTSEFCSSIENELYRQAYRRNIGSNFGSVALKDCADFRCEIDFRSEIIQRLETILAFDATLLNNDRQVGANTNLLYRGEELYLIDHSYAISVYAGNLQTAVSPIFYPPNSVTKHCVFSYVKNKGLLYQDMHNEWLNFFTPEQWEQLRNIIPAEWETKSGDLDLIFDFLQNRHSVFQEISSKIREVTQ